MSSPKPRLLILFCLLAATALADAGGSFRFMSDGPRALALAGASSFGEAGLEAIFTQPASLVLVDDWEGGVFWQQMAEGLPLQRGSLVLVRGSGSRQEFGGGPRSGSTAALGAAFQYMGATLADESDWSEWSLAGAAAWSPFRWVSLGMRGTMSRGGSCDGLDEGSAMSLALGARFRLLHPKLELGLFMDDLYHSFSWKDGGEHSRDPVQSVALGWDGLPLFGLPGDLRLEARADRRLSELESYGVGAEWTLFQGAALLRGGLLAWRLGEERRAPSFGIGLRHAGWAFDYGYRNDAEEGAGSLHRLSLSTSRPWM